MGANNCGGGFGISENLEIGWSANDITSAFVTMASTDHDRHVLTKLEYCREHCISRFLGSNS